MVKMKQDKKLYVLMLFCSTMLGAAGQILFKLGVSSGTSWLFVFLVTGLISYLVSTVIYFYVLSKTHLSWAYGFTGLSYIFASAIAFLFLGEQVPALRWTGILIIAVGTALVGSS